MAVLSIDYRLAPEHPYPAGLDDSDAALRFLATHGPDGPDDPTTPPPTLFVAGDSAGGGLGAALALRPGVPAISGLVLFSAWLDLTASGESHESAAFDSAARTGDPVFTYPAAATRDKVRGWGLDYLGASGLSEAERAEIARTLARTTGASPLFAPSELLAELPPMLVQLGEAEILRSDSVEFAARAREAGAACELEVWPRMWHCFHQFSEGCAAGDTSGRVKPLEEALVATERAARFMRAHLARAAAAGHGGAAAL